MDAMSSFGAVPIDMPGAHIDFLDLIRKQVHRRSARIRLHSCQPPCVKFNQR